MIYHHIIINRSNRGSEMHSADLRSKHCLQNAPPETSSDDD